MTANMSKNKLKSAWLRKTQTLTEDISYLPDEEAELISFVLALDERYRIPIHLFYYEGYRIEEIAALTGSKAATVGTRLARGRAQLKDMLGDDFDE